jgi:hypothetical protein
MNDAGGIRYSAVVAGTSRMSQRPSPRSCSVASRSETRSWCGENVSYGSVSQSGSRRTRASGEK